MLKFLPIVLLSSTQKVTNYAQYYAHNYCDYATVHIQLYSYNDYISIVISPACYALILVIMLCCIALIFDLFS